MTVISFDTLKYSKKLMDAGVSQQQAEGQAEALAEVIEDQLATKQDIQEFRQEVKHEFRVSKVEIVNELLIKLGGFIAVATAILGVLISLHH